MADEYVMFLFLPTVGALIGWLTNRLAVRLLFRPYRAVGIGPVKLQGLLPRRREELTATVAKVVEEELLSFDDLKDHIITPARQEQVAATLVAAVTGAVKSRLPVFMPEPLSRPLLSYVQNVTRVEARRFVNDELPRLMDDLLSGTDVAGIIEARLDTFNLEDMEELVYKVASRELSHIEWLGGAIGAAVGVIQAIIVVLLPALR